MTIVIKSWGRYEDHLRTKRCVMKTLTLEPGLAISLQYHLHRNEFWVVESGEGLFQLDDCQVPVTDGFAVMIKVGVKHKLTNTSQDRQLTVREIQFGEMCSEEDIVRLD